MPERPRSALCDAVVFSKGCMCSWKHKCTWCIKCLAFSQAPKSFKWRKAAGMQFVWYERAQYFEECPLMCKHVIPDFCSEKVSWVRHLLQKRCKCLSTGCTCYWKQWGQHPAKRLSQRWAGSTCLAWSGLSDMPEMIWSRDPCSSTLSNAAFSSRKNLFICSAKKANKKAAQTKLIASSLDSLEMLNASESSAKYRKTSRSKAGVFQVISICLEGRARTIRLSHSVLFLWYDWISVLLPSGIEDRPTACGAFSKGAPNSRTAPLSSRLRAHASHMCMARWCDIGVQVLPACIQHRSSKQLYFTSLAHKFSMQAQIWSFAWTVFLHRWAESFWVRNGEETYNKRMVRRQLSCQSANLSARHMLLQPIA